MSNGGNLQTVAATVIVGCVGYAAFASSACGTDDATIGPGSSDAAADGTTSTTDGSGSDGGTTTTTVDSNEAARAAVVLGSCVPDDGVHRYLADIYYQHSNDPELVLFFQQGLHCLATTNTGCAAVKTCLGLEIDIVPDAGDCVRECNGNIRTACDGRLRFREDCERSGQTCVEPPVDAGRAICVPPGLPACPRDDGGGYNGRCEDGRPTYCIGPVEMKGIECASEGLVCGDGRCTGSEGTCTSQTTSDRTIQWDDGISCSGTDKLKACVNGGIATIECAKLNAQFTCHSQVLDGGKAVAYCGLGEECKPPSRQNLECNGDSVVVCNAGRTDLVDCKSLGFTTCEPGRGCVPFS